MKPEQVLNLYKKRGETPLERLERFRRNNSAYKNIKMTYAGRLDPMAEGVMLVVCGSEIKNKDKYLSLDKEYQADFLFGIETDTFDLLGKVKKIKKIEHIDFQKKVNNNLKRFVRKFKQTYPTFSSKTVNGKQLHFLSKEGSIDDIILPKKLINIYDIKLLKSKKITSKKLFELVIKEVSKIKGDFRQSEIIKIWKNKLGKNTAQTFYICELNITCSSGTYVRRLAQDLGQLLGVGAVASRILRLKVGKYKAEDSIK